MDEKKIKEYQAELQSAMVQLKNRLAECQGMMGVIESFLYLLNKENKRDPSMNGKEVA